MKFSKNLMTGLIGLALMAAPITAAAQDNNRGKQRRAPGAGANAFERIARQSAGASGAGANAFE